MYIPFLLIPIPVHRGGTQNTRNYLLRFFFFPFLENQKRKEHTDLNNKQKIIAKEEKQIIRRCKSSTLFVNKETTRNNPVPSLLSFLIVWSERDPGEQVLPFCAMNPSQGNLVTWIRSLKSLHMLRSGTDPRETLKDVCRDLIISVFTKTLLMVVKMWKPLQCLTIGLVLYHSGLLGSH